MCVCICVYVCVRLCVCVCVYVCVCREEPHNDNHATHIHCITQIEKKKKFI